MDAHVVGRPNTPSRDDSGRASSSGVQGELTFLFTDIEGSTRRWEEHPEAMGEALARHDSLLLGAIRSEGGKVFKHTGDGLCVVFADAGRAVRAAAAGQLALAAETWRVVGPLHVRMALYTGSASTRSGDYFGPSLNRTARLLGVAHGGQVLVSAPTAELVRRVLPAGWDLVDLGEHRLAGLPMAQQVFQLRHPELPHRFPHLRSLDTYRHNLPVALSAFVGRADEVDDISVLVETARLITLVGIGGVGKSRLAVEVATRVLPRFRDGVFLVELAALTAPELVAGTLRAVLGLRDDDDHDVLGRVAAHLADREVLVVLDNCEHLLAAAAHVGTMILSQCPDVTVLATSREPLDVPDETVWRVRTLGLPPTKATTAAAAARADAVTLFCARARGANPAFSLRDNNAATVVEICHQLDGIPLALELAASRLRALSLDQVAARLADRFALLSRGASTSLSRHQTLYATLEWSYDLAAETERTLLRRLSVFAGGFELAAAEVVCDDAPLHRGAILDVISRLVDKSLVLVDETTGRYRLLETVRQYAAEKLVAAGEEAAVTRRHAEYFTRLVEPRVADPFADTAHWLRCLAADHDNFRVVLERASATADVDASLALVAGLWDYWVLGGHLTEGCAWAEGTLARAKGESPQRIRAVNGLGLLVFQRGDAARSALLHQEALAAARSIGDTVGEGVALLFLGGRKLHRGEVAEAGRLFEAGLAAFEAARSAAGAGWCLFELGWMALARGEAGEARSHFADAATRARQARADDLLAHAVAALAPLAAAAGDDDQWEHLTCEALEVARGLGLASTLVMALTRATQAALLAGDIAAAKATLVDALGLLSDLGGQAWVADSLELAAVIRGDNDDWHSAATLLGASEALRGAAGDRQEGIIRNLVHRCHREVVQRLGPASAAEAHQRGRTTPTPQLVALALEELRLSDH